MKTFITVLTMAAFLNIARAHDFRAYSYPIHLGPALALALNSHAAAEQSGVEALVQQTQAILDVRPAFMQIITNSIRITNMVIVTNYVVTTNITYKTNLYNAQGLLLQPVEPVALKIPGLIPITNTTTTTPTPAATPKPSAPDPAIVLSNQVQAIRELFASGITSATNKLGATNSFISGSAYYVQMPSGITSFDRKKTQTFMTAMNTAARQAIPDLAVLLQKTASNLQLTNPASILQGGNDAATKFLSVTAGPSITNATLEIVNRTATAARLPEAYQSVMLKGGGLLGAMLGTGPVVDVNSHITQYLLEAAFKEIQVEENRIRSDASAQKTKVLQDAFKK